MEKTLGIDIGGVIIDRINDGTDTSFFGDNYLKTTAVPDAFESIAKLAKDHFKNKVFLVSKCGEGIRRKTLEWLAHHRFYGTTGVPQQNVHFCYGRNEKADICRRLEITHFVDDKLEVLGYLIDFVKNLYLFNPQEKEVEKWKDFLPYIIRVKDWNGLVNSL